MEQRIWEVGEGRGSRKDGKGIEGRDRTEEDEEGKERLGSEEKKR